MPAYITDPQHVALALLRNFTPGQLEVIAAYVQKTYDWVGEVERSRAANEYFAPVLAVMDRGTKTSAEDVDSLSRWMTMTVGTALRTPVTTDSLVNSMVQTFGPSVAKFAAKIAGQVTDMPGIVDDVSDLLIPDWISSPAMETANPVYNAITIGEQLRALGRESAIAVEFQNFGAHMVGSVSTEKSGGPSYADTMFGGPDDENFDHLTDSELASVVRKVGGPDGLHAMASASPYDSDSPCLCKSGARTGGVLSWLRRKARNIGQKIKRAVAKRPFLRGILNAAKGLAKTAISSLPGGSLALNAAEALIGGPAYAGGLVDAVAPRLGYFHARALERRAKAGHGGPSHTDASPVYAEGGTGALAPSAFRGLGGAAVPNGLAASLFSLNR